MPEKSILALTVEADHYLAEADALKYGDPYLLLSAAQTAGNRSQLLGDFRRYAQALTHQAWAFGNLNQYEMALTCSLEALALARGSHFVDIEARAVGIVALNFCRFGMYPEAKYLYEHQLELGVQLDDNAPQAMALNDMSLLHLNDKDVDGALDLLHKALVLMPPDTHDGVDLGIVQLNLAIAHLDAKHYDEVLIYAQQVLARVISVPRIRCDAHLCLASVYLARNDSQSAHMQLRIARDLLESTQPPIYNDNVEQFTAELLMHEQRYREAIQVWEAMYDMAVQRRELDYAISILQHIKGANEQINDTAGVISAYKRLSEDIPTLQKQGSQLRFSVLRLVFAIDKAAIQAELQLTRQKTAILERLSHEFRTPLAIIQTATQLIEKYGDQMTLEQRQERLQRITEQVKWMTIMLDDILELLRLDEGNSTALGLTWFQLDALAQGSLLNLERYRLPHQTVRVVTQPNVGAIHAAQEALKTVIVHLLTNAIKFSKYEVTLELSVSDGVLVIRVSDRGIGILPEDQEKVFQPLVRGSNLDEVKGSGLGLAIVAKLVEQMHGVIDLTSAEGQGTTFTVSVPLA